MINWIKRNDSQLEKGKEYLVTDGERIITASFNTPYSDKSIKIWFSEGSKNYCNHFNFTHYAEINLPS